MREFDLIRIETRPQEVISSQSRTVLIADRDGWLRDPRLHGLFIHETRVLSRYVWRVNGDLYTVEASPVHQFSRLSYHIGRPRRVRPEYSGAKRPARKPEDATEETLELKLCTLVSDGLFQTAVLSNYTTQPQPVALEILYGADFAGQVEVQQGRRQQKGRLRQSVEVRAGEVQVQWRYHKSRHAHGVRAAIDRGLDLIFRGLPGQPRADGNQLTTQFQLAPGAAVTIEVEAVGYIDGIEFRPLYRGDDFNGGGTDRDHRIELYQKSATMIEVPHPAQRTLERALDRAVQDLIALRMFDLDREPDAWVPAAGIPIYVATFGRDILSAAWMSALLSPAVLTGALHILRETQGKRNDPWRDEEPGKMLHEAHTGPISVLNYRPQGRYYGSFTTSPFYTINLSEFYHWTGDKAATEQFLPAAEAAMGWVERHGDLDGDGFYEYRTRSRQGVKNQAWKDSGDAIIYPDGQIVANPIGTCEQQGYVYEALLRLVELQWISGRRWEAGKTFRRAQELKKRFNAKFWMAEENFFAMAKDAKGRLVRSIGSNPGDALATGIIAPELAAATAERLMRPDLFSGWGVRTLSAEHRAYNPYSYHRGSVWPSENASICVGLRRYGMTEPMNRLAAGLLGVAAIFSQDRLPEVFSGHPKDAAHPFPAVYPKACSPQAWSAGALVILLQMILGVYPYAPMRLLFVEPALPDWLPQMTIRKLRVGDAVVSLRFWRDAQGRSQFEVLETQGRLRVIRQASPWSLYATPLSRAEELISSLAA
ncbi:MAG: glycogen debranching N-terminal domain-containing protein [Terriglobales bacterium]